MTKPKSKDCSAVADILKDFESESATRICKEIVGGPAQHDMAWNLEAKLLHQVFQCPTFLSASFLRQHVATIFTVRVAVRSRLTLEVRLIE